MHKFYISDIFTKEELLSIEDSYNKTNMDYAVRLISDENICYFPIAQIVHKIIFNIFEDESGEYVGKTQELSLHRTMLDSMIGSDKELASVILDLNYDSKVLIKGEKPDFELSVSLTIVDAQTGKMDSIVDCDFSNALILALMTGSFLFFTNNLYRFFFYEIENPEEIEENEFVKPMVNKEEIRNIALNILKSHQKDAEESPKDNQKEKNPKTRKSAKKTNNKKTEEDE